MFSSLCSFSSAADDAVWHQAQMYELLSSVGKRLAKTAEAIGMRVIGTNSKSSRLDLESLLQQADIVSLHCPVTPKTHQLIG